MPVDNRSVGEIQAQQLMAADIETKCAQCGKKISYHSLVGDIIRADVFDLAWCKTVCYNEWLDENQNALQIHFAFDQTDECKIKVLCFVKDVMVLCKRYDLAIVATNVDGLCINGDKSEAYTWNISNNGK